MYGYQTWPQGEPYHKAYPWQPSSISDHNHSLLSAASQAKFAENSNKLKKTRMENVMLFNDDDDCDVIFLRSTEIM